MNLGFFLMIVALVAYIFVAKKVYGAIRRKQQLTDYQESQKDITLNRKVKK